MPLLAALPGVRNLHPAYSSILISFDPLLVSHEQMGDAVRTVRERTENVPPPASRVLEIPVFYGGSSGPDLDEVAKRTKLTAAGVIALHSSAEYLVYFLGFSPGFAYLGGMPIELRIPRRDRPRRRVPAGSVAIGDAQTGIYPVDSPGGWHIIGRTPLPLFRPEREPPCLLRMGDRVRFIPSDAVEP